MNKQEIVKKLEELKKNSKERGFTQSIDLHVSLKNMDFKKPEHKIKKVLILPHSVGKKRKICAIVGKELLVSAQKNCDHVITQKELLEYASKPRRARKLARAYDFFIAQANLMPEIAKTIGKYLGAKGKMPDPRAGCVQPPTADLKPIVERLQKLVTIKITKAPTLNLKVGSEDQDLEEVADNILSVYETLKHDLPLGENQIKKVCVKLTMSKPIRLW